MARKKTEKYDRTERLIIWAIRVCVILLIVILLLLISSCVAEHGLPQIGKTNQDVTEETQTAEDAEADAERGLPQLKFGDSDGYTENAVGDGVEISVSAGYVLKADSYVQNLELENYASNPCAMIITFYLADGTMLYQSPRLNPGDSVHGITMQTTLQPGTYRDALMVYEFYDLNGGSTATNRCEFPVELRVSK